MTAHTTRRELEGLMDLLCSALDDSDLHLDYYAAGGGYRVMGGSRGPGATPFGTSRRPAREMASAIRFALDALHYDMDRDR